MAAPAGGEVQNYTSNISYTEEDRKHEGGDSPAFVPTNKIFRSLSHANDEDGAAFIRERLQEDEVNFETRSLGVEEPYMTSFLHWALAHNRYLTAIAMLEKTSRMQNPTYAWVSPKSPEPRGLVAMIWQRVNRELSNYHLSYPKMATAMTLMVMLITRGAPLPPKNVDRVHGQAWQAALRESSREIRTRANESRKAAEERLKTLLNMSGSDYVGAAISADYLGVSDADVDSILMGPPNSRLRCAEILQWTNFTSSIGLQ
jgi:hypothetical protein